VSERPWPSASGLGQVGPAERTTLLRPRRAASDERAAVSAMREPHGDGDVDAGSGPRGLRNTGHERRATVTRTRLPLTCLPVSVSSWW
jgi:hypothetical protein